MHTHPTHYIIWDILEGDRERGCEEQKEREREKWAVSGTQIWKKHMASYFSLILIIPKWAGNKTQQQSQMQHGK